MNTASKNIIDLVSIHQISLFLKEFVLPTEVEDLLSKDENEIRGIIKSDYSEYIQGLQLVYEVNQGIIEKESQTVHPESLVDFQTLLTYWDGFDIPSTISEMYDHFNVESAQFLKEYEHHKPQE